MSAAERQRQCRARKRGESHEIPGNTIPLLPGAPMEVNTNPNLLAAAKAALALPAPPDAPALPAPPVTAIQKASPRTETLALPEPADISSADPIRLSLPPAVAARLKSLLARHKSGKGLTPAERAEAEGLLDIAEFFAVHRMRRQLAA